LFNGAGHTALQGDKNMTISTAAAVPTSPLPALSDASDGVTFTMLGASIRLIARANDTDGRFTVFEQTTPAGWGPPRHVHAKEDEIVYVLDGTYEVSLGDERRTVSAGGCAILPRGIPHGFRNVGETPARFVCVVAPGGLEEFFLEIARCAPPPSPAQLVGIARTYGLTLLPPGA
jgi:quercetin dioxygenase-like cupin family protein